MGIVKTDKTIFDSLQINNKQNSWNVWSENLSAWWIFYERQKKIPFSILRMSRSKSYQYKNGNSYYSNVKLLRFVKFDYIRSLFKPNWKFFKYNKGMNGGEGDGYYLSLVARWS